MLIKEKPIERTITQVAEELGISEGIIRRYCRTGRIPDATYHPYPGTSRGYYTLAPRSVEWLRENVTPRKQ